MLCLFKSHYSIGKSILTLNDPSKVKPDGPDSIFKIAIDNGLKEIVLVEDSLIGFFEAYKRSKELDIKLIFGLRLSIRNSADKEDDSSEHKIIIFAKNKSGCQLLNRIYSKAFCDFAGFLDYETLCDLWDNSALKMAIPFYDSFLHVNKFLFGNAIPNFYFTNPTFFIESNGLVFDHLLKAEVEKFTENQENYPTQKVKSIYYKNKKDAEALMTYKIICNRGFGRNRSLSRPELAHFNSDEFCFESWKENI